MKIASISETPTLNQMIPKKNVPHISLQVTSPQNFQVVQKRLAATQIITPYHSYI